MSRVQRGSMCVFVKCIIWDSSINHRFENFNNNLNLAYALAFSKKVLLGDSFKIILKFFQELWRKIYHEYHQGFTKNFFRIFIWSSPKNPWKSYLWDSSRNYWDYLFKLDKKFLLVVSLEVPTIIVPFFNSSGDSIWHSYWTSFWYSTKTSFQSVFKTLSWFHQGSGAYSSTLQKVAPAFQHSFTRFYWVSLRNFSNSSLCDFCRSSFWGF